MLFQYRWFGGIKMDFLKRIIEKSIDLSPFPWPTVVFLGDSVTQGCFELTHNKDKNIDTVYEQESTYYFLLKKRFTGIFPNVPLNFINSGISGGIRFKDWNDWKEMYLNIRGLLHSY
jgi:lysophospholipase L1-like esterase